ncbi:hypothetical protein F5Y01DRAFT_313430 [Xylaria sp. FL0043]|nr:hypothetical protein F5Y01DRAFT_313430 [Xylaria sp. FL0043]
MSTRLTLRTGTQAMPFAFATNTRGEMNVAKSAACTKQRVMPHAAAELCLGLQHAEPQLQLHLVSLSMVHDRVCYLVTRMPVFFCFPVIYIFPAPSISWGMHHDVTSELSVLGDNGAYEAV